MPASPSSLIASLSRLPDGLDPAGLGPAEVAVDLPAALAQVPDPRARRGIRHRLTVVITTAVCAVVAGYRFGIDLDMHVRVSATYTARTNAGRALYSLSALTDFPATELR